MSRRRAPRRPRQLVAPSSGEPLSRKLDHLSAEELELADVLVTGISAADRLRGAARQGRVDAGTLDLDEIIAETKAELDLLLLPPEGKRPH